MTPTGRRRFRVEKKWGQQRLVLQIEETGHEIDFFGGYVDRQHVTRWRDAKVEDLTVEDVRV